MIIDRLNKIALGQVNRAPVSVQIRAADMLLRKTVPDLTHVENAGGRTLDEILFAGVALVKTGQVTREPWVLPSEPLELDAPLKSLDEADGGE